MVDEASGLRVIGGTDAGDLQAQLYSGGTGGGGGMDPWQQAVKTRLTSLDGRIGRIEGRIGKVETGLATLTERVAHLPTKTWLGATAITIVGALTVAIGFADTLQVWFGQLYTLLSR